MNKIILAILSVVVISVFLVGCAKESDTVDVVDEKGNIVGEAFKYAPGKYKLPAKVPSSPLSTAIKVKLVTSPSCGEDYHLVEKSVLTEYYLTFFNGEYSDWYVCDLNNDIKAGTGLTCQSRWGGPQIYGLYAYSCYVTHATSVVPNAPTSVDIGCGVNYQHNGVVTMEPIIPGQEYYSSFNCQKKGARPANSPCSFGYNPNTLWNVVDGHVICGKKSTA
ncbi:hypothetical protein COY27_07205 [Candidatus Woesearchaeota archaeon CG_4_10_14_0_2_um_filter_33_13]|nr:MAG: hypothetical protein COY27_07205 [Candidatus Woesearchaeota archaeon CG_4_10_14_0_2_um_filter_33_13]